MIIERRSVMIDLVYVLATLAFFAAMIGYVAACERLGRAGADELAARQEQQP